MRRDEYSRRGRLLVLCVLALALPLLVGCQDKMELNDRAYVNAVGLDKAESEAGDGIRANISLSDLQEMEGSGGGEEAAKNKGIKQASGQSVTEAMHLAGATSSQNLFFGHTKTVLLGEDLLRDKKLFMETLDALERDKELSRKILVMAAVPSAEDLIGLKPEGEPSIGNYTDKFYRANHAGIAEKRNLEQLLIDLRNDGNALIPKISAEEEQISIQGAGVIKNLSLIGFMDEKELKGILWQTGRMKGERVLVRHQEIAVPFTTLTHAKAIRFYEAENQLVMSVKIEVEGNLDEYMFGHRIYSEQKLSAIERLVEEAIAQEVQETNRVLQKIFLADVMDINAMLKKRDYALWEKLNPSWENHFQSMNTEVQVTAQIRGIGVIQ